MKKEIIVADSAGFCFGVKRAVGIAEEFAEKGNPAVTLGEIIHNPTVVESLRERGVFPVESVDDVPEGYTLILRSHGVPLSVVEELEEKNIPYADATCPFVARIHRIVAKQTAAGDTVIITGNPDHAEVRGIIGHANGDVFVVRNLEELEELSKNHKFKGETFLMYCAWYGFGRGFIELLRTDSLMIGKIKVSCLLSFALVIASVALIIYFRSRAKDEGEYTEMFENEEIEETTIISEEENV